MIELRINNSECSVSGLSKEEYKLLKDLLSYETDNYAMRKHSQHFSFKRALIDAKGRFPTGLLFLVEYFLESGDNPYSRIDLRRVPSRQEGLFTLDLGFTPYPDQINASLTCLKTRGIIVAPTGVGKSAIVALIIDQLQVPTLVVVPSLELKRQLIQSLKTWFGEDKVGKGKPIYVANVDSLDDSKVQKGYDCVVIDEFHRSGAKSYRKLNKKAWSGIYYKFGLTATNFRSQENERLLLESVLSEVIYQISYQDAVAKHYIVPMEAYFLEVPRTKITGKTWAQVYSELVVNNQVRNHILSELLLKIHTNNSSTLCLVKEIKHGEILRQLTDGFFAHGESEDTPHLIKMFNSGKLRTLIGTTGVLSEGVDTKPTEIVIIAGLGKSRNQLVQSCGRGFRIYPGKTSCKIILIKDDSHKWSKAHFKEQCRILKEEYNVIPAKLNLT